MGKAWTGAWLALDGWWNDINSALEELFPESHGESHQWQRFDVRIKANQFYWPASLIHNFNQSFHLSSYLKNKIQTNSYHQHHSCHKYDNNFLLFWFFRGNKWGRANEGSAGNASLERAETCEETVDKRHSWVREIQLSIWGLGTRLLLWSRGG